MNHGTANQPFKAHNYQYIDLSEPSQIRHTIIFASGTMSMALRQAFATVLKRLRLLRELPQIGFTNLSQSQVSSLEAGNSSPTLDTTQLVADQLDISTAALLALTCAADSKQTPQELLEELRKELQALDLLDACVHERVQLPHPNAQRAAQLRHSVQELKAQGLAPTEVSRRLEISVSTVKRHWK